MHILLVSATSAEIAPLTESIDTLWRSADGAYTRESHRLEILITGVGMVATTYALTKALQQQQFDLVLQAGIAGSFRQDLPLGSTVVQVSSEMFGDLGAENHYNFLDVFELGLTEANIFPFSNGKLHAPPVPMLERYGLPKVSSLSVNSTSGSAYTAAARRQKFGCDIENMEGAAFHYVCLKEGVAFAQIRSLSNYVTARDKSQWQIKPAIDSLNAWLSALLKDL